MYSPEHLPIFADYLKTGDTVVWGQATAEPLTLTRALIAQRHLLPRVRLMMGIDLSQTIRPEHADAFDFAGYCGAGGNRQLARAALLDLYPLSYSQLATELSIGHCKADVVLIQVPPPNAQGRFSLGLSNDWLIPALKSARVVIAEVNATVPWSYGGISLSADDLDLQVPASYAPLEYFGKTPSDTEAEIAKHVASLIEDGSVLQVGLGGVASRVLSLLKDRRDLGFHSGLAIDALVDLVESGALTNAKKTIDAGVSVAGILMGSRRLYDFAHLNPSLQLRGSDYTHEGQVLRSIKGFVAINSALEVDLTGQVNAEVVGGNYVGAVGGAPDFLRAAHLSQGGLPIIALPATEKDKSRIVVTLSGPVSTPRCDAGVIVTEHGIADLRGLPMRARIARMIDLAAPEHRTGLARQALVG
jgi:acyl-CoA hydrolase